MKKTTAFFIFSCFCAFTAFPQNGNKWTLQQCIDYALKYNPTLKQNELTTEINAVNLKQSKYNILPTLNGGANHTYNIGRTIDRYTNTFANATVLSENFYLASGVTLWSGLQQYNLIKRNQYTYLASLSTYEQQKYDLALNVSSAFLQVVYNQELLKVATQQADISNQQLERTQKLADAGSMAMSSVYDIKAQLATDQYSQVNAQNNYNLSMLSLKQLLYLDTLDNFDIERPNLLQSLENLAAYNPLDIYNSSLKTQPRIKSAEYTLMSSEKNLSYARGRISPTLSFNASIGTGYSGLARDIVNESYSYEAVGATASGEVVYAPNPVVTTRKTPWDVQFSDNINKSLGFTLNIPLFNGLSTYSNVQTAKLQLLSNKYNYDIIRQQLYKTIVQAHTDAQGALNKYAAAKAAYEASDQAFNYAQQKFNAGVLNSFDYNNSKNRLLKTQTDMLNAQFDFAFRLKVLDYYQGKPLAF